MKPFNRTITAKITRGALSLTLVFLLIEFFDELHYGLQTAVLPSLRLDLGLTYAQVGLLLGLPQIIGTLIEPLLMLLGDRSGYWWQRRSRSRRGRGWDDLGQRINKPARRDVEEIGGAIGGDHCQAVVLLAHHAHPAVLGGGQDKPHKTTVGNGHEEVNCTLRGVIQQGAGVEIDSISI
jgi:hypothetical protein